MSGDHDRRTQGGRVGAHPGGGGGGGIGEWIKHFHVSGGSPMGVFFYVGSLFSPRKGHFLRMLWGVFLVCPPLNFFCWNPYNCYHIFFYFTDIIISSRSWRFEFFRELIFFLFLRGGGLREGGRLLSTFRLFLGEHAAGPGGGRGGVIG